MPWKCEYVHEIPLRPARTWEEFQLHLAALDWTLDEPIVLDSVEDAKSRSQWNVEPFAHQVQNLITFCRRAPVTLLADDVGLGKTISAGLILSELRARKRVQRALVICPKILGEQWVEELDTKFGIEARVATEKELAKEVQRSTKVVITTYTSATKELPKIDKDAFGMLILDEAHKLKHLHGAQKTPKMALSIYAALKNKLFKYVLMLTATPIQNSLWDLYSLLDCLTTAKGHINPLGTPDAFRNEFLAAPTKPRQLNPRRAERFRNILREYIVRIRRHETGLMFPERNVSIRRVPGTHVERECHSLVRSQLQGLNPLEQISLLQALYSSPHAFAAQLENMAGNKADPQRQLSLRGAAEQVRRLLPPGLVPAKVQGLLTLIDELRRQRPADWRLVVFTRRKETQRVIGEILQSRGITFGFISGDTGPRNQATLQTFKERPAEARVLISTDAGAEGVNLQACNVLVNYDLPWNPMVVEQRIGRVQRLGSTHKNVVIWNLVVAESEEERIVARLMEKLQAIAQSLGDIESILEAANADEVEGRFEEQIRAMVVQSLLGQDVKRQQQQIDRSIEEARQRIAREREEIDKVLGRLDELHRSAHAAVRTQATRRGPGTVCTASVPGRWRRGGSRRPWPLHGQASES